MTSPIVQVLRDALGGDADAVLDPTRIAERPSSYWDARPMQAAALARPRSTGEVSRVLAVCHARNQAVVTHGGLTGCVEGALVDTDAVVLSLERMNRIEEVDPIGRTATVQAGVVLQSLHSALKVQLTNSLLLLVSRKMLLISC